MTDREKAIVMAYTGVVMLQGDRLGEFYAYVAELFGRPLYTHEIALMTDIIKEESKSDFLKLCQDKPKKGKWIDSFMRAAWICSECRREMPTLHKTNYCPNCGADMRGVSDESVDQER